MADALSPNPSTTPRQRAPMASRVQSPTSPFHLGSNDDQLERPQAREERAAAIRRKPIAATEPPPPTDPCLCKEQVIELFQNCVKLSSGNKINRKNTWELNLIDHLSEIIKVEAQDDVETNFQKASCTLEAGVKIYSLRVDSMHSEAYKVLGGSNRAGRADEHAINIHRGVSPYPSQFGGNKVESGKPEKSEHDGGLLANNRIQNTPMKQFCRLIMAVLYKMRAVLRKKRGRCRALNVKKFDVAFAVDPLYHQTSARFDEGGAKGLLLNDLGVYGGCLVLFDSMEAPGKCMANETRNDTLDMVDLSFVKVHIEQMVVNMCREDHISPTLRDIIALFDKDNQRKSISFSVGPKIADHVVASVDGRVELNDDAFVTCNTWVSDHDDKASVIDETNPSFPCHHVVCFICKMENDPYTFDEPDVDDRFEKVAGFLYLGLGLTTKQNAWAGPDHWKYRKAKDEPGQQSPDSGSFPSWGNDSVVDGQFDDGNLQSDVEDSTTLISQPRQVNKIEVQYDKTSKQVDVHALKETLWSHMRESEQMPEIDPKTMVSFRHVLGSFPDECQAAACKDISPHLCFICLLHLANEHGLTIHDCPSLDDLHIFFPHAEVQVP
ncbi:condensin complex subunit 2-like [Macadamia integrifolia]|uniref:condensin complex subunit 2-like n=1 Tax=Macadamia integrifolia TaxID=60698 RepID=UPI001C532239|nr:condensin complex subunit 2-like [Macadamia integrifolia]